VMTLKKFFFFFPPPPRGPPQRADMEDLLPHRLQDRTMRLELPLHRHRRAPWISRAPPRLTPHGHRQVPARARPAALCKRRQPQNIVTPQLWGISTHVLPGRITGQNIVQGPASGHARRGQGRSAPVSDLPATSPGCRPMPHPGPQARSPQQPDSRSSTVTPESGTQQGKLRQMFRPNCQGPTNPSRIHAGRPSKAILEFGRATASSTAGSNHRHLLATGTVHPRRLLTRQQSGLSASTHPWGLIPRWRFSRIDIFRSASTPVSG